jgi:divalent metal cation (Fe/Co/Zn/Cd) transporter
MAECSAVPSAQPVETSSLVQKAKWLAYFTIAYNIVEGIVSIGLGVQEESFALAGFGFDSLIEVASAVLVVWRLRADFDHESVISLQAERKTTFGIGLLFVLLSLVTAAAAITQLVQHKHPDSTVPGLVIAVVSLSFMFFLWKAKLKVARKLNSKALAADAACSLACIQLSGILFAGSILFWLLPSLWWVDAVAALGISTLVAKEGLETIQASQMESFQGGCGCS